MGVWRSHGGENKPFRDGSYCKRLWVGKRTVKQGECAAIWDDKGTCTLVLGPRRVWAFFSTIRFLTFHRAGKQEYIVVNYKDGRQEVRSLHDHFKASQRQMRRCARVCFLGASACYEQALTHSCLFTRFFDFLISFPCSLTESGRAENNV